MGRAMVEYKSKNGDLPDRILVYRDGVGDGQLQYILEHELPQINAYVQNEKCRTSGWEPTLAYIGEGSTSASKNLRIMVKNKWL